jgi:vitamin B12 transporter
VFARAENVLDQDYQEVFGFETPGLAAYGGIKVVLGANGFGD